MAAARQRDAASKDHGPRTKDGLRTTDEGRRTKNGSLHWTCLPPVPPRGDEAVPQGRALLYRQVRDRETQLRAGAARKDAQTEAGWLWCAAAREAEGEAHLRGPRGSVPPLLRAGGADARHHRRDAAAAARAAPRQRRLPSWPGDVAGAGPPGRAARPPYRQRPQSRYPVVLGQAGRHDYGAGKQPQGAGHSACARGSEGARRAGMAPVRRRRDVGEGRLSADARADQPARAGTADRRALLEVSTKTRRESKFTKKTSSWSSISSCP